MFKRLLGRSLILALCLVIVFSMVASGASTTKSLSTNFTVVNLGTDTATVSISYVKEDGSAWTGSATTSLSLAANGGQGIVYQYSDPGLGAGRGSVVLSSTQPLGAVVQILDKKAGELPSSGAYNGFSAGAPKFYAPLVLHQLTGGSGLSNSQIMIQNTGDADIAAGSGNVIFSAATGTPATFTKPLPLIAKGATWFYDVADETNLSTQWSGSVVVDAGSGTVAVVVNNFSGPNGLQTYNAFPSTSAGPKWAVPLFWSQLVGGKTASTPVSFQNLSGGTIASGGITLTCTAASGSLPASFSVVSNAAVVNNGVYSFNPVTNTSSTPAMPTNWQGSCVVDSGSANGVVLVQMRKLDAAFKDQVGAYEAFNLSSTDTKVVVPLADKRLANGFATVPTFQNLSNQATVVKLTYTTGAACLAANPTFAATYVFDNIAIPANGSLIQNLRLAYSASNPVTVNVPDKWYGSITLEHDTAHDSNPARPFAAFSQLTNINALPGDTFQAHDDFTLP